MGADLPPGALVCGAAGCPVFAAWPQGALGTTAQRAAPARPHSAGGPRDVHQLVHVHLVPHYRAGADHQPRLLYDPAVQYRIRRHLPQRATHPAKASGGRPGTGGARLHALLLRPTPLVLPHHGGQLRLLRPYQEEDPLRHRHQPLSGSHGATARRADHHRHAGMARGRGIRERGSGRQAAADGQCARYSAAGGAVLLCGGENPDEHGGTAAIYRAQPRLPARHLLVW